MLFGSCRIWSHNSSVIQNARINQYSSADVYARNQEFGDLWSTFTFKSFMQKVEEMDGTTRQYVLLMDKWVLYQDSIPIKIIETSFIGFFIFGFVVILKSRDKKIVPFMYILGLSVFFLANQVVGVHQLNELFRTKIPVLGEAFRFPFTKFIFAFVFVYSLCVGYGLMIIKKYHLKIISVVSLVALIFVYVVPAFGGNFFSPLLQRTLPRGYTEIFQHLQAKNDNKRILLLPAHTFWSWQYNSWGQFGSGFLWFGIPQPLLSRAFDPWSQKNEQAYNEFHFAMRQYDNNNLQYLLKKYNIGYVLYDESILSTESTDRIDIEKDLAFLNNRNFLGLEQKSEFLHLFSVDEYSGTKQKISRATEASFPSIWLYRTPDELRDMDFYSLPDNTTNSLYPFANLYSEKTSEDVPYTFDLNDDTYRLSLKKSFLTQSDSIISWNMTKDTWLPVRLQIDKNILYLLSVPYRVQIGSDIFYTPEGREIVTQLTPEENYLFSLPDYGIDIDTNELFYVNSQRPILLKITSKKQTIFYPLTLNITLQKYSQQFHSNYNNPQISIDIPFSHKMFSHADFSLLSQSADNEKKSLWLAELPQSSAYIFTFQSEQVGKFPPEIFIDNPLKRRIETSQKLTSSNSKNIIRILTRYRRQQKYSCICNPMTPPGLPTISLTLTFYKKLFLFSLQTIFD